MKFQGELRSAAVVRCSVLQCIAFCCSVLRCVPVRCSVPHQYGVASISRLLKIIGLFCRISSLL